MKKNNIYNKVLQKRCFQLLMTGLIGLLLLPLSGQETKNKKTYTPDLDSLWSIRTFNHIMSPDGNWLVIGEGFHKKGNTLTLKNTESEIQFDIGSPSNLTFSADSKYFGYLSGANELTMIQLENQLLTSYKDVTEFDFSHDGKYIAIHQTKANEQHVLLIHDLNRNKARQLKDVVNFKWNPLKPVLAVFSKRENKAKILLHEAVSGKERLISEKENVLFSDIVWNNSGNALVFLENSDQNRIHYYNINGNKRVLDNSVLETQFQEGIISDKELSISADGKNVFFYRRVEGKEYGKNNGMEIWDTKDPWIYPRMKNYNERETPFLLTLWNTNTNKIQKIADKDNPSVQFNPDHPHALVFNQLIHEPLYKQYPEVDLYIKDFQTGSKELIVKNQYTYNGFITLSPKGRYVAFFKEKNWWVYDSKTKKTINLTEEIQTHFENIQDSPKEDKEPYGNPGWSDDENYIILQDQYDIWLMKPDGSYKKRITKGKESKIRYTVSKYSRRNDQRYVELLHQYTGIGLNPENGITLEMLGNDLSTGYAIWKNNKIETLIYEPRKIDNALTSYDNTKIVYRKQKFNESPGIYSQKLNGDSKLLYQSNKELLNYNLGKSEFIHYQVNNQTLKGVLIYPALFNPNKSYPMITWIYENKSIEVNNFAPPSYYSSDGFNLLKYVTNGYFVFMLDIEYTNQGPGVSALNSVEAGVRKVLESKFIDNQRIGLIGHSFGGYETAYIMTRSNLFATGVAGASVTDLPSFYHDIGWDWYSEQAWRMENHQMRMGGSFYDLKERYFENSPMNHIKGMENPLLLWAGKLDSNINWQQSIYMYMAMKRLNKEGKLVLFNDEGHAIVKSENQKHLSLEVFNWFSQYLK